MKRLNASHGQLELDDNLSGQSCLINRLAQRYTKRPQALKQVHLEIYTFSNRIKEWENEGMAKSDIAILRMEVVGRREDYRLGTGLSHYYGVADVAVAEKLQLIKLYKSLNGCAWINNFSWVGQEKTSNKPEIRPFEAPSELLYGIVVNRLPEKDRHIEKSDDNYIIGIELNGNGCLGEIVDTIGDLKKLKSIDFGNNVISGKLPRNLKNLTELEQLKANGNQLAMKIDRNMFLLMKNLHTLDLSSNKLIGGIPDVFDEIPSLTDINFSNNMLDGTLPETLGSLIHLKSLKLFSNALTGEIPSCYQQLTALEHVNLSRNQLTNGIAAFYSCHQLKTILLRENKMNDTLSPQLGELTALVVLQLCHNQFKGKFEKSWCNMRNLIQLNLKDNDLIGTLPREIGQLEALKVLILSENHFCGPVPKEIELLRNLHDFQMLTSFPSDIMHLPKAFNKHVFEQIFVIAPRLHLNNVTWEEEDNSNLPPLK